MGNILSPWKDGEEKLRGLNAIIKYDIDINNFRDYLENNLWQGWHSRNSERRSSHFCKFGFTRRPNFS
jgi:hypothetical protein